TDGDPTNDPTVTSLMSNSSLILTKTASVTGGASQGNSITYTFTVENTGIDTITNIVIDDALTGSVGLAVVPGTLAPGEIGTATATYTITQFDVDLGYIENSAIATGQNPAGNDVSDISDAGDELTETPNGDGTTDGDPTNDPTIVITDPVDEVLVIYDFITPDDGNGRNDFFNIEGLESYPNNNLKIYNRWGVLVFEQNAYQQPGSRLFDGTSNGRVTVRQEEKLPAGVYYYVLTYDANGVSENIAGPMYIKR
ncbi:MAG: gliding motility-associated C-terminal domain-containing protein, partial [Winogradskyella sp.]|nr:gliding motility-associated C-terminal domain-containing protein [Winogradskyella sp.]